MQWKPRDPSVSVANAQVRSENFKEYYNGEEWIVRNQILIKRENWDAGCEMYSLMLHLITKIESEPRTKWSQGKRMLATRITPWRFTWFASEKLLLILFGTWRLLQPHLLTRVFSVTKEIHASLSYFCISQTSPFHEQEVHQNVRTHEDDVRSVAMLQGTRNA